MWRTKMNGARQRNIFFSLTVDWFEREFARGTCAATGLPFEFSLKGYRVNPFSPHVDRIDPQRGYTEDNSQVVCAIYNMAKLDWPEHVVLRMANALVSFQTKSELLGALEPRRAYVSEALKATNISATAELFGVSRPTIYDWIKVDKIPVKYLKRIKHFASEYDLEEILLCPDAY